jgi:glycine cleavage system transcriptional repressor
MIGQQQSEATMAHLALVNIFCADATGLIAAVTGRLFDLGVNLGDTSFAVLGEAAELTAICELPDELGLATVERELRALPVLAAAALSVAPFAFRPTHAPSAKITHRIEIIGDDSPGLVARLSEVLGNFGANIVTLNSEHIPGASGAKYLSRLAVWLPADKANACLATIANTAAQLSLDCRWEAA